MNAVLEGIDKKAFDIDKNNKRNRCPPGAAKEGQTLRKIIMIDEKRALDRPDTGKGKTSICPLVLRIT